MLYPFQNLRLDFILKIFLKFRKFQPGYSHKIYSYKKKKSVVEVGRFHPVDTPVQAMAMKLV